MLPGATCGSRRIRIIDPNLRITGPDWNEAFAANHYQIEVAKPMFVDAYRGALDNFARAAVRQAYEDARK